MRRVPLRHVDDLDELERTLSCSGTVLILDADDTLVPTGAPLDEFRTIVGAAIRRLEDHPSVGRVIVVTNGAERGVAGIIHRGNKPWTSRRRLGLESDASVVVVGDKILTDGILAWRLGAPFVHLRIGAADASAESGVFARRVRRLLFAEER